MVSERWTILSGTAFPQTKTAPADTTPLQQRLYGKQEAARGNIIGTNIIRRRNYEFDN